MIRRMIPAASAAPAWPASLELGYAHVQGRTLPLHRRSHGPLRLQKSFWPETAGTCHQIIVHPPGGIAGGDDLRLRLHLGPQSSVLLTTPGAAKWYRSLGSPAHQQVQARLEADSRLEWLPNENIVFDGALAELDTRWELAPGARLIAADMLCLGRPAGDQPFSSGRVRQRLSLHRWDESGGRPLFTERLLLSGDDRRLSARVGLGGAACLGTLIATLPVDSGGLADAMRQALERLNQDQPGEWALTCLPELLVLRWMGPQAEPGWRLLRGAWQWLRPAVMDLPAHTPRIWAT